VGFLQSEEGLEYFNYFIVDLFWFVMLQRLQSL